MIMVPLIKNKSFQDSPMRLHGSSASSASVASRLYGTRSRRDSLGSDPELISFSDTDMHDITNQVTMISKKLSEMEEQQLHSNDERGRLRTENAVLTERVHVLEEQLLVAEQRFREQLQDEKNRTRELLQRIEREKQLENESLSLKYQTLYAARKEAEKAREETAKQLEVVEDLRGQLAENKLLIEDLEDERIKFKEEAQQDIDSSSEMVEVLTQQTEELRRNGAPRQGSIIEQMSGLEESLEQARADIRDLQRERDDLQAQLLAASVERGRSLLADEPSLADELMSGGGDSQQILEALREQEVCNQKLRVYINGILMRVIERHPEILEIGERTEATSTQLTVRRSSHDSASRRHARFVIVIVNVDAVVVSTSDVLSPNIVLTVGLT
ncbi:FIP domain protein [Ostertagia ostertagi]